jgi:diguanylate cyclase (GGDEF)-like protein
MVINYRDITERKELEARLRHQAMHDALTGLPNRDLFYDRVDHALEQRRRSGGMIGIVYVDLDNFKMVNDAWGHAAGDEVLVAVAQRLRAAMRDSDTCARLGGDEFGVLLESLSHTDAAYEAGARVLDALGLPVDLDTRSVDVEASAGIVIATGAETVDEIIRNADIAMYRAKGAGKGRYEIFEASMRESVRERVRLRADLERGLAAGEFVAHYQPIVALSSMTVVGVEALVRWHHPQRGLLAPEAFITVAEETGVVVPIGRNILAQACRDVRGWRNRTGAPLRLGVNLSGRELADPELERYVVNVLEDSGLDPHLLSFELTENMLLADVDTTQDTLRALSLLGAGIVLDDFGTGYSSLAYLERYPVDVVKIDKSFVDRLGDVTESPMAGAIIALGHTFDVSVNAEGVERRTQVERLHELGCELAQGRYFASPRPAADISRLLLSGGLLVPTTVTEV